MKLKEVFSISGKPGLYVIVSGNKMPFIVEQVGDAQKRVPVFAKDRIVSLADISIYTEEDDVPLGQVMDAIKTKQGGAVVDEKTVCADAASLKAFMTEVYPSYDKDRVHNGDIKKLVKWYNILINAGIETFVDVEEEAPQAE
ncbi:DUF5606 domain-containing protein [Porphyromonas sp.]|uniref:DUF5606 family protein n=1 Tax=Porphyromonas sp. TaxID=1924944 RepID=UPI0026DBCD10|nr:DUF5606 domain-containing protein [Porphyromonas sp.]MDO4770846.1 DUF5606 domain-containing protein [Porphyromonas sp.]